MFLTFLNTSQYKILCEKNDNIEEINLSSIENKTQIFAKLASHLQFPEYSGYNWDAVNDCLSDFLLESKQYKVIVFSYQKKSWIKTSKQLDILIDIIECNLQWMQSHKLSCPIEVIILQDTSSSLG
tara:strand:- start:1517 stop:1894 length:378 start_codon:yes stop_codon:yes gene_type:complete